MSMSIETLLRQVPELTPSARQMAEDQDDEPCLGELLEALAGLVSDELAPGLGAKRAAPDADDWAMLGRWFAAVEALAADDHDCDAPFLVGSAFLDSLGPDTRARATPWLGPATRAILADLDASWPQEDFMGSPDEEDLER